MNILRQFNAVDVKRSSVQMREVRRTLKLPTGNKAITIRLMDLVKPEILVLKRDVIAGGHLWHGTTADIYQVFFSNDLHDAVLAAGLSPLTYEVAQEI
jgi:hypothetical protein